jgi:hypothetical protein
MRTGATLLDESGLSQHPEMLRDGGSAHIEMGGDLARRPLLVPDEAQDHAGYRDYWEESYERLDELLATLHEEETDRSQIPDPGIDPTGRSTS